MKVLPLLGLAVLCLLPRASALTITQSASETRSGNNELSGQISLGSTFFFQPFDASYGLLDSVTVSVQVAYHAALGEMNPFQTPLNWTPSVSSTTGAALAKTAFEFVDLGSQTKTTTGNQITIAPQMGSGYSADYVTNLMSVLTAPASLALVNGPESPRVVVTSNTFGAVEYGSVIADRTARVTLTYSFHAVPDVASTAWLLGLSCLAVGFVHRRSTRSFFGA